MSSDESLAAAQAFLRGDFRAVVATVRAARAAAPKALHDSLMQLCLLATAVPLAPTLADAQLAGAGAAGLVEELTSCVVAYAALLDARKPPPPADAEVQAQAAHWALSSLATLLTHPDARGPYAPNAARAHAAGLVPAAVRVLTAGGEGEVCLQRGALRSLGMMAAQDGRRRAACLTAPGARAGLLHALRAHAPGNEVVAQPACACLAWLFDDATNAFGAAENDATPLPWLADVMDALRVLSTRHRRAACVAIHAWKALREVQAVMVERDRAALVRCRPASAAIAAALPEAVATLSYYTQPSVGADPADAEVATFAAAFSMNACGDDDELTD
jgi:hypothetical protein